VEPIDAFLQCNGAPYDTTWTPTPGANEARPINCENWYEAYAFCIWDGGFLPSEAEWNYAATGGAEQRVYPWSNPPTSTLRSCSYANYYMTSLVPDGSVGFCVAEGTNDVGSESPLGDGKYGQADLGGNLREWNLDLFKSPYVVPCTDCAYLRAGTPGRVFRGGSFLDNDVRASGRAWDDPLARNNYHGARCARSP
jgi:formylglycine-generating enzyme required for sulfatase activity